jgi:hypothetical protein
MTDEHRKTLDNLLESLEDGLVNHLGGPPKNANSERLQREVSALRAVLNGLTITVSVSDGEDPEDLGAVLHFVADRSTSSTAEMRLFSARATSTRTSSLVPRDHTVGSTARAGIRSPNSGHATNCLHPSSRLIRRRR